MWKYATDLIIPCQILVPGSIHSILPTYWSFTGLSNRLYHNCEIRGWIYGECEDTCTRYNRPGISIRTQNNNIKEFCIAWWVECEKCKYYKRADSVEV